MTGAAPDVTPAAGLGGRPRVPLATLPTPLHPAARLSARLGVPVWFKRDDLTGLGLGGNKVRVLEYLLGDAVSRGCDVLVTGAGPQSNWAMLAALAARRCGLDAVLCLYGTPPEPSGNLLLIQRFTGATVRWTGDADRASVDRMLAATGEELRRAGRRPYEVPRGGATAVGALGYVAAAGELAAQVRDLPEAVAPGGFDVWLATGSCGTQAGLVAGLAAGLAAERSASHDGTDTRPAGPLAAVVGVTVSRPLAQCRDRVREVAREAAAICGGAAPAPDDVTVLDGWIGPGYGRPSAEGERAAGLVAETEGVLLDPVFGAKAAAALIHRARTGGQDRPVVFLVSGGAPALFARAGGT